MKYVRILAWATDLNVRSRSCDSVPDEDSRKGDVTSATDDRAIMSKGKMQGGI